MLLLSCAVLPRPCVAQIPAFSGAEGAGSTATGGRGQEVYHVTTLDASGPGSFVDALSQSNRIIVFDVSGVITLNTPDPASGRNDHFLRVGKSNITIAGQTAPGSGIVIQGTGMKFTGSNVVVRNISTRPGSTWNNQVRTMDGLWLQTQDSIFDHISVAWASDEGISSSDAVANTTVQYSIAAEGLMDHSYGGLLGPDTSNTVLSYHHNLFTDNRSRNPRLGNETGAFNVTDFRNNVLYNWGSNCGYSGSGQEGDANFVGNYYVAGPSTSSGDRSEAFSSGSAMTGIYQSGNKIDPDRDGVFDGVNTGWSMFSGSETQLSTPLAVPNVTTQTADNALNTVLDHGGANWWSRTSTDTRLVSDVRTAGTAGKLIYYPSEVGGWPTETELHRPANWDTDQDGMPDAWEEEHGLDPNVANNSADFDSDGYTDIEEYINDIAAWPAPQPVVFKAAANGRYAQITNWDITWQPSRFDEARINSGTVVVDAVGQHAGSLRLGTNPGDNATLNITAGWIKVEDSSYGLSDGMTVIGDDPAATATLNLSGGRLVTKTLLKGAGGTFNFTGGVLSAETVGFDLVNNGGSVAPGNSAGLTHVMGDLTINSGALQIEIGGTSAGEFDSLVMDGAATLGGALEVSLLDGFAFEPDDVIEILNIAGARTGEFAGLGEGALVGNFGQDLFITYAAGDGNDVALYTLAGIAGDFDGDGDVDGSDFLVWQRNPGIGNLGDWQANFGTGGAQASGAAVPEPASQVAAVLLFATIATLARCMGTSGAR